MVVNVTKISEMLKNKSLLSIEKNIIEWEKTLYYDHKSDLKSSFEAVNLVQKANLYEKKKENYKLKKVKRKLKP